MKSPLLRMRRLGWSGVEIEYEDQILLIDYIQDTSPLIPLRSDNEPFPPSSRPGLASVALLTHLHSDHADPEALKIALQEGAPVFRPAPASGTKADLILTDHAETNFSAYSLTTEVLVEWEERTVGPFRIHTAPAVDGFGDPQLTWIIECGQRRIIHAGDTLFHGLWWRIANKFGPFDVAFLPINAPLVDFPHLQPASGLEAVMNPEQAATAAHILNARLVVPIHYSSLHKPPMYIETQHPTERLREKASNLGLQTIAYPAGEWFNLD